MKKNLLYTLIINYTGGTYIYQTMALDELEALRIWVNAIPDKTYEGIEKKDIKKLLSKIENDPPQLISGTLNCWCADIPNFKGNYLSINIVKTTKK
ncbi:MAG: hypothetical protein ACEQSR_12585 [Candidatus Methylacidiphilales bacterium]